MVIKNNIFSWSLFLCTLQLTCALPIAQQFKQAGYVELCDKHHEATTFEALYACFDELIAFLHTEPAWAHKLYIAKERFIRSAHRNYYSTDFFGLYDESRTGGQIAFYYSTHFHAFMFDHYPECASVAPIARFLQACQEIQKPYAPLFEHAADELGLQTIFSYTANNPPVLFKVVKYLPSYRATRPHYDGTALSLFLDSTDNQSLFFAPYKPTLTVDDFSIPVRENQHSILLIPGALLTEFSIYPTAHIVVPSGKTRYATIAFAMRPDHTAQRIELSHLPNFKH